MIVTYRYRATIPHDADATYAWLTDYQDTDAQLSATMIRGRRVTKREPRRVEFDADFEPLGTPIRTKAVVELFPEERRYVATLSKGRIVGDYRVTPTAEGCRIEIAFRVHERRFWRGVKVWLSKPRLVRETSAMWADFLRAMDADFARVASPTSIAPPA